MRGAPSPALRPCPEGAHPGLWVEFQRDLPPEVWPEDCASWYRWKAERRGWETTDEFGIYRDPEDGDTFPHYPVPREVRRQMDLTALRLRLGWRGLDDMDVIDLLHFAGEAHLYRSLEWAVFRRLSEHQHADDLTLGLFPAVVAVWGSRVATLTVRAWAERRLALLAQLRPEMI